MCHCVFKTTLTYTYIFILYTVFDDIVLWQTQHTIIFSNRAKISFSEVIFDESSSNWCELDDEEMDQSFGLCLECDMGGRSFLLPGIRILANRSSYADNTENTIKIWKVHKNFWFQVKRHKRCVRLWTYLNGYYKEYIRHNNYPIDELEKQCC